MDLPWFGSGTVHCHYEDNMYQYTNVMLSSQENLAREQMWKGMPASVVGKKIWFTIAASVVIVDKLHVYKE